jgi:Protein of unknown function (DUF3500)
VIGLTHPFAVVLTSHEVQTTVFCEQTMPDHLNRRQILTTAVLLGAPGLGLVRSEATEAVSGLGPAEGLIDRTSAFLGLLDGPQRKAASFEWNGTNWRNWNYYGASGYIKPGLRLEQMTGHQKDQAWEIFSAVLSPMGLQKARNVMLLQDVLMEIGDGVGQRSPERFSVSVFGRPAMNGAWGIRLEGHHLSLSFAVREGVLVSVTPAAFAVRPNRVTTGRHAGLNTLKGEELLARRIFGDLPPELKARALLQPRPLFNIMSGAGQEREHTKKVGLPIAEMTTVQQDLVWQLVETYAVEPYAGSVAVAQKARIRSGDAAAVHFAWYGPNVADKSFGYRVIGDTFVIELGCIDDEAQHIHPVYHDIGNVLGRKT